MNVYHCHLLLFFVWNMHVSWSFSAWDLQRCPFFFFLEHLGIPQISNAATPL